MIGEEVIAYYGDAGDGEELFERGKLVRCKDCRWSEPNNEGDYDCKCHIPIFRVPEDGWCYLGERIEE